MASLKSLRHARLQRFRSLKCEALEDRRVLAVLTVNVAHDNVESNGGPIRDDGDMTLRDAVAYVSQTAFPQPGDLQQIETFGGSEPLGTNDKIVFSSDLFGSDLDLTIDLAHEDGSTGSALVIWNDVVIDGGQAEPHVGMSPGRGGSA